MTEDKKSLENPQRRDFLTTATGVVAGVGVTAACWPFVSSMNPSSNVLSSATTEASLKGIRPGEAKTVEWQGKPIFILHRQDRQIAAMEGEGEGFDPQEDDARVKKPEWLVVIGICTHLGCVPLRKKVGWHCPCHGSIYDDSGRVLKGPAPLNLYLPEYEFDGTDKIIIGAKKA